MGIQRRKKGNRLMEQSKVRSGRRGDNMSEINEFMSEHWVILYGILMFVLGEIAGYIKAKR
jgi:hypothetical protein